MKERSVFIEGDIDIDEEEFKKLINESQLEECSLSLPRGYLSPSQVDMYLRCGVQYMKRYVEGKIAPPGVALVEGSSIHKALEVALTEKKNSNTVAPVSVMLDAWSDRWKEGRKEVVDWGDISETSTAHAVEKRARAFITEYQTNHLPKVHPIEVEKLTRGVVGESRVPVLGYIDLVHIAEPDILNGAEIVDHKVLKAAKTEAQVENDLQLSLYAHCEGIRNVAFNCFVKTKIPKISKVKTSRTRRDLDWMENVFNSVAVNISAGVFMPCDPTGWACTPKYCGYYRDCRGKK